MIDVHIHLHPPRLHAAIRRWFAEHTPWALEHQPTEPDAIAAALRAEGVRRFVYCSYAHKPGMARELNAWLIEQRDRLGGYGLPLATVHVDDDDPVADLREAMDAGCLGIKLHEDVQRIPLDHPRLQPVLAELAARGGYVLTHVGPIPWVLDSGDGPARVARVLDAHPALRIVVAHFGVPDHRRYLADPRFGTRLFLDTTMAFTAGSPLRVDDDVDGATLDAHAHGIVFGTDFPTRPQRYTAEREGLEERGLSPDALAAIVGGNAGRVHPALAEPE